MSVTLDTMTVGNPSDNVSSSGTVRYFASADFTPPGGSLYKAGDTSSKNWFLENTWVKNGSNEIVVAQIANFPSTTDANPQGARIDAVLYDSNNKVIGTLFEGWQIPPGTVLTRDFLLGYNGLTLPLRSVETLSKADFLLGMNSAIATALGTLNNASNLVIGRTKLSVAPVSSVNPIAVGDNDPRILHLNSSGDLTSTGGIIIGADTDASGTDTVQIQTRSITRFRVNNDGTLTAVSTKLTLGDSTVAAGARIDLTIKPTNTATTGRLFNWWSQTFPFTNGPGGEPNYDDDEQQRSYNRSTSGSKTVAGIKDYAWVDESRFYQGAVFQSEHYFEYRNPAGTLTYRPFGMTINETDSSCGFSFDGAISFQRAAPNHATQTAIWYETGSLQFIAASATILFPNNVAGLCGLDAAGSISLPIAKITTSDQVEIAPGGQALIITSTTATLGTSGGGASTFIVEKLQSRIETDTYIQMPGSDIMRFFVGGSQKIELNSDGVYCYVPLIFITDGASDIGKTSGVNRRPNNVYVKTNVEIDGVYKVGANQVVGARVTGWTAATGTATRTTFATASVTLPVLAEHVKALIDDLMAHGVIGT